MKITIRIDLTSAESRAIETVRGVILFAEIKRNLTIDAERLQHESGGRRGKELIGAEIRNVHNQIVWIMPAESPRFPSISCSQCGESFGPGDHGFSSCDSHEGMVAK